MNMEVRILALPRTPCIDRELPDGHVSQHYPSPEHSLALDTDSYEVVFR